METSPYSDEQTFGEPQPRPASNVMGIIGFVLSVTCLLSPVGLLMSLFALTKKPRGFAIAGVLVGLIFSVILGLLIAGVAFGIRQPSTIIMGDVAYDTQVATQQIDAYRAETGSLPASLEDVAIPPAARTDAWGNEYRYEITDTGLWDLVSAGPDGTFGTDDDFELKAFERAGPFSAESQALAMSWNTAAETSPLALTFEQLAGQSRSDDAWLAENARDTAVVNPPPAPAEDADQGAEPTE